MEEKEKSARVNAVSAASAEDAGPYLLVMRDEAQNEAYVVYAPEDDPAALWSRPVGCFSKATRDAFANRFEIALELAQPEIDEEGWEVFDALVIDLDHEYDVWKDAAASIEPYVREKLLAEDGSLCRSKEAGETVCAFVAVEKPAMTEFFRRMGKGIVDYPTSRTDLLEAVGNVFHEAWRKDREGTFAFWTMLYPESCTESFSLQEFGAFAEDAEELGEMLKRWRLPDNEIRDRVERTIAAAYWETIFRNADSAYEIFASMLLQSASFAQEAKTSLPEDGAERFNEAIKREVGALQKENRLAVWCKPSLAKTLLEESRKDPTWPRLSEADFDQHQTAVRVLGSLPLTRLFEDADAKDRTVSEALSRLAKGLSHGRSAVWGSALAEYDEKELVRAAADVVAEKAGELGKERAERLLADRGLQALTTEGQKRAAERRALLEEMGRPAGERARVKVRCC